MKDIKKPIAKAIEKQVKEQLDLDIKVELSNPIKLANRPAIILHEVENASKLVLDGKDRLSSVVYQIDVYATGPQQCESIAIEVNAIMTKSGFSRQSGTINYQSSFGVRRAMRFFGTLDEQTTKIYGGKN